MVARVEYFSHFLLARSFYWKYLPEMTQLCLYLDQIKTERARSYWQSPKTVPVSKYIFYKCLSSSQSFMLLPTAVYFHAELTESKIFEDILCLSFHVGWNHFRWVQRAPVHRDNIKNVPLLYCFKNWLFSSRLFRFNFLL